MKTKTVSSKVLSQGCWKPARFFGHCGCCDKEIAKKESRLKKLENELGALNKQRKADNEYNQETG